jgi:hypothetical protein
MFGTNGGGVSHQIFMDWYENTDLKRQSSTAVGGVEIGDKDRGFA